MTETFQWHKLYRAAALELDPMELKNKIELASGAMRQRDHELTRSFGAGSSEEQRAIADAFRILGVIERLEIGNLEQQPANAISGCAS